MHKYYKENEWDFEYGVCGYFNLDENIYIDKNNKPITGILENFYYFKKNDQRNNQFVKNGKRIKKETLNG